MGGRTRLIDVATHAGVSQATASRALVDDPRISARTRAAVKAAAAELQYIPNAAARNLRSRRTRTLGLVIVDLSDPFHGMVAQGFEMAAGEAGYTVIFASGLSDPVRERRALKVFVEHGTDGIALVSSVLDPREARSRAEPDPLVLVQPDHRTLMPGRDPLPDGVVQTDDVGGVEQIVDHLIERGYRDIGYVGAGVLPSNAVRRETAVRRLRHHGVRRPLRRFQAGIEGYRSPGALAAIVQQSLPEALICYDDKLALALLDALRGLGVRVPDHVAIVGFDDVPFASIANPRLTTVTTPTHEMGRVAARGLIQAIQTGTMPPATLLPVRLAPRESTPPVTSADRRPPARATTTPSTSTTSPRPDSDSATGRTGRPRGSAGAALSTTAMVHA
ncbi:MAG TPA: LacI family DNA-binding transcriptional regulator [Candidatus Limnocylindrales bacterium]|nr:LacI family DNA-binding transcriptional regulator [Candidatus Limnocylindrales bacterium]